MTFRLWGPGATIDRFLKVNAPDADAILNLKENDTGIIFLQYQHTHPWLDQRLKNYLINHANKYEFMQCEATRVG